MNKIDDAHIRAFFENLLRIHPEWEQYCNHVDSDGLIGAELYVEDPRGPRRGLYVIGDDYEITYGLSGWHCHVTTDGTEWHHALTEDEQEAVGSISAEPLDIDSGVCRIVRGAVVREIEEIWNEQQVVLNAMRGDRWVQSCLVDVQDLENEIRDLPSALPASRKPDRAQVISARGTLDRWVEIEG